MPSAYMAFFRKICFFGLEDAFRRSLFCSSTYTPSLHRACTEIWCALQILCVSRKSSIGAFSPISPIAPSRRHQEQMILMADSYLLGAYSGKAKIAPKCKSYGDRERLWKLRVLRLRPHSTDRERSHDHFLASG